MKNRDTILVIDFGSQYTHLIANRIRRLKVYSEICSPLVSLDTLQNAKGIILSGGPSSVYDPSAPKYNQDIFKINKPLLGLCYGYQLMTEYYGGTVSKGVTREYGSAEIEISNKDNLFKGLSQNEKVWMSHGDLVENIPEGFINLAFTRDCPHAAMGDPVNLRFGLQFHPEVTHTPNGIRILENFLKLCKCKNDWSIDSYIDELKNQIIEQVGSKKVFLFVSGGVDSTIAFTLLNDALGKEKVQGLHIDNGLMRKNESQDIEVFLRKFGYANFHVVNASNEFVQNLNNKYDPEEKRKSIGETFIQIQKSEMKRLNLNPEDWLLGQGTIYPDTIETGGTQNSETIKTHHNRIPEIQKMIDAGKVVEPLVQLYKDEVRVLGEKLNIPPELVWRHPFPGPGLGVRILCSKKVSLPSNEIDVNNRINKIIQTENYKGVILPVKTVGVQGDGRTFTHPYALIGKKNWDKLDNLSTQITNSIAEINRAVILLNDISINKLQIKKSFITKERLDLLREADSIVMDIILKNNLMQEVWQLPTILIPVSTNGNQESIVLRPVNSREAMTAQFSRLPWAVVEEIREKILGISEIEMVFYDITNKPPGTIEWE